MISNLSDLLLVQACLRGDAPSQRALFARHRSALRSALTGCGFDEADVAELEQRVWLRLLGPRRALASFRGRGSLPGWLRRIGLNEGRSELRRRRRAVPDHAFAGDVDRVPDGTTPERSAIRDEKRKLLGDALRDAVDSLDACDRRLLLAWAEGATTDALANEVGVHRSTVSRKLDKLRRAVGTRTRARLWEHYGRTSSELSLTHVDIR